MTPFRRKCYRCGYRWEARVKVPHCCPRCGDPNYARAYVYETKGKRVLRQGRAYRRLTTEEQKRLRKSAEAGKPAV